MSYYDLRIDAWTVVLTLGIVQGIVLSAVLLLNKKGNRIANSLLASSILLFVWIHLECLSIYTGFFLSFPHFFGPRFGIWFLLGPLFYFYVTLLTSPAFRFKKSHFLHFVPATLSLVFLSDVFQNTENKVTSIKQMLEEISQQMAAGNFFQVSDTLFIVQFLHMLVYILLTIKILRTYSNGIKNEYSNLAKIGLRWFRRLTIGFASILCLSFLFYMGLFVFNFYTPSLDYIYTTPMTVLIYVIGFYTMLQPEVYRENFFVQMNDKKYGRSSLKETESKKYLEKLLKHMETGKPYMDNDLKLTTLASQLNVSAHHLSQIINEQLSTNFYDFVNRYRVEEAKKILSVQVEYEPTLLQVAFDAGFNNKVSFNNYFKKFTGITPSEFRKSINFNN